MGSNDARNAFHEVKFQYADIGQMSQAFVTLMSILERLLVISPQEIGGQASHQQSKAEVTIVAGNTTNRVSYTGGFIDEAEDAWKKQLYQALIAYMDSDVVGQVTTNIPDLDKRLDELGFKSEPMSPGQRSVVVKGDKQKLRLEGFASTREGPERGSDKEAAQAILMALQSLNNNQRLSQIVDPNSILEMLEQAARMMGADSDFKIRVSQDGLKTTMLQDAIQQITQQVMQQVVANVAKPAAEAVAEQSQKNTEQDQHLSAQDQKIVEQDKTMNELAQVVTKMQEVMMTAVQAPPAPSPGALDMSPPPGPPMPPPAPPMPILPDYAGPTPPINPNPAAAIPGMA
jgi:hypothetical protein